MDEIERLKQDYIDGKIHYRKSEKYPGYMVGTDGSVWSRWKNPPRWGMGTKWRKLKPTRSGKGSTKALDVMICVNKKRLHRKVHRLVLELFVGPCPDWMEGCHNDGNYRNNAIANLRWDNHVGNEEDKAKHGTRPQGEKHKNSTTNENTVRRIRRRYAKGGITQERLGKIYRLTQSRVSAIIRRKAWSHIK